MSESADMRSVAPVVAASEMWVRRALFWSVAVFVVALDQLVKIWIRAAFPVGATQPLLEGWLRLTHSENTGAAWSMLAGQRWPLVLISVAVSAFILFMAHEFSNEKPRRVLPLVALGFIFGGAIGNLIDRVLFGVVTDMIDLDTPLEFLRTFPIFNLADSALTVGVVLLMLHFVLHRESSIVNQQS